MLFLFNENPDVNLNTSCSCFEYAKSYILIVQPNQAFAWLRRFMAEHMNKNCKVFGNLDPLKAHHIINSLVFSR